MAEHEDERAWTYEPSAELALSLRERLQRYPREPDMIVYVLRAAMALVIRLYLRLYHRLEIRGRRNLPKEESFILVSNHASHLDALCLLAALPLCKLHRAFPAAAADYFFEGLAKSTFSALFLNAIPFQREAGAAHSLALCRILLEQPGIVLVLFPEGTRTTTGQMAPFRPGIGYLSAGCRVPVLPCRLRGAFQALPKGAWFPRPRKLSLVIGPARAYPLAPEGRAGALAVAQDLERAVAGLKVPAASGPGCP